MYFSLTRMLLTVDLLHFLFPIRVLSPSIVSILALYVVPVALKIIMVYLANGLGLLTVNHKLTDQAYESYLKTYYENMTRERAVLGSLFTVDISDLTTEELSQYIRTLVRDYIEVMIRERHLYHILRKVLHLPPEFRLDEHTTSFEEDDNDKT